jgi:hypothetical protein
MSYKHIKIVPRNSYRFAFLGSRLGSSSVASTCDCRDASLSLLLCVSDPFLDLPVLAEYTSSFESSLWLLLSEAVDGFSGAETVGFWILPLSWFAISEVELGTDKVTCFFPFSEFQLSPEEPGLTIFRDPVPRGPGFSGLCLGCRAWNGSSSESTLMSCSLSNLQQRRPYSKNPLLARRKSDTPYKIV